MTTLHTRLSRYAHPIGPPPVPSEADREEATRFIEAEYADAPVYLANNRETLIRYAADAVMQSRMGREHRARRLTNAKQRAA